MSEEKQVPEHYEPRRGKFGRIFVSLVTLLLIGATAAAVFLRESEMLADLLAQDEWLANVVGNFHPLTLHLPIGIVFMVLVAEVLGWLSFGKWKPVLGLSIFFAVFTGCLACLTGLVDMVQSGYTGEQWERHMWSGLAFVSLLAVAFLMKIWGPNSNGRGVPYAIVLFLSAGVMGFGAHLGGEKVHGPLFPERKSEEEIKEEEEAAEVAALAAAAKAPEDRLAYEEVVKPILQSRCVYCHEEGKEKGGLNMESFAGLLAGGDGGDDHDGEPGDETLVPGRAAESLMSYYLLLPEEHEMHMPPSKEEQPEPFEKDLIVWWINSLPVGATEPSGKTLGELDAPTEILDAAKRLVSPEERARLKVEEELKKQEREAAEKVAGEALESEILLLKEDAELKNTINYVSRESRNLDFTAVSLRENLTEEHLRKLKPVAGFLEKVDLGSTRVTESAMKDVLSKMTRLKKLNLRGTGATDELMKTLGELKTLEWLNLYGTQVSDEGLKALGGLKSLKKLYLFETQVTRDGVDSLQEDLPDVEIIFGGE